MAKVEIIASYPPYGTHRGAIAGHALVSALRFNTIVPVAERKESVLARMKEEARGKTIWLDLKCRQLRITHFATLPYARVRLNHRIETNLPVTVLFKDGIGKAVEIVHGNELVFAESLFRVVGAGESVNILDPSLRIKGFLSKDDKEYIAAARANGLHDYMLSFVEEENDFVALRRLDPRARIVAKIESRRGLVLAGRLARAGRCRRISLMAACDDLYINMGEEKTDIFSALRTCRALPQSIVASRILTSLERQDVPSMPDLMHLELLYRMGYRRFMLSDQLCYNARSFALAMQAFERMLNRWSGVAVIQ